MTWPLDYESNNALGYLVRPGELLFFLLNVGEPPPGEGPMGREKTADAFRHQSATRNRTSPPTV